jgi:sigma-B regulation protein RsbU (phosphoserine phosphatase)
VAHPTLLPSTRIITISALWLLAAAGSGLPPAVPPDVLARLRADAPAIACGMIFLVAALVPAALGAARRPWDRTLFAIAACGGLYGSRLLVTTPSVALVFGIDRVTQRAFNAAASYFILVGFAFFLETLVSPRWRRAVRRLWQLDLAFAVAALAIEAWRRAPFALSNLSSLLVLLNLLVFLLALTAPGEPAGWELRRLRASFLVFAVFILGENLRALGLVPFPAGIEPIGLLLFIAGVASIAVRRFFATGARLTALRQELETARGIQASILPRELPRLAGLELAVRYVPAADVAGDLYDFLPGEERRLGVLVADVSGHGVPAALIASMVKVAAAAQAAEVASPGRMLSGMNRIFFGRLRSQFVTAAYLFFDLEASRLLWASAGHPPPLLLRGGRVRELTGGGPVMGRLSRAEYSDSTIALEPGDRLLLFSDGIPEAPSPGGEPFGDARLQAFFEASGGSDCERFADALLARLEEWSGVAGIGARSGSDRGGAGGGMADDLTLVVAQVGTGAVPGTG